MKLDKSPLYFALLLTIACQILQHTQVYAEKELNSQPAAEKAKPDENKALANEVVTLKKQTLTKEVEVKGAFHPAVMEEIVIRPEVWTDFKIEKVVSHGTMVKKGDVLIQFDTRELDEQIEKLKVQAELKNLGIAIAVEDYKITEELYPQELETAEKNLAYLKEDREYTKKIGYPLQDETLEFRKKTTENQVAYAEEELKQLQKMYKEDGLTEETEEIVLKRTKDTYEQALFAKKMADENYLQSKNVSIPRQRIKDEHEFVQKELDLSKQTKVLPMRMAEKKLELFKLEKERIEAKESLQKHIKDRELCTITAPADGYVYYGEIQDGSLVNANTYAKLLAKDAVPPLKKTILTVCNQSSLLVHCVVDEGEIDSISTAQSVTIIPKINAERKLAGKVHHVQRVPGTDGKFPVNIKLDDNQNLANIYATMSCQCKIKQAEFKDVLAVPQTAIHQADDKSSYVYLKMGDKYEIKTVKTGETVGKMTIITEGLSEADQITTVAPVAK